MSHQFQWVDFHQELADILLTYMLQLRHNDVKHLLNIVAKWLHRLSLIIPLQFELPVTL